jgi:hypothetical protein
VVKLRYIAPYSAISGTMPDPGADAGLSLFHSRLAGNVGRRRLPVAIDPSPHQLWLRSVLPAILAEWSALPSTAADAWREKAKGYKRRDILEIGYELSGQGLFTACRWLHYALTYPNPPAPLPPPYLPDTGQPPPIPSLLSVKSNGSSVFIRCSVPARENAYYVMARTTRALPSPARMARKPELAVVSLSYANAFRTVGPTPPVVTMPLDLYPLAPAQFVGVELGVFSSGGLPGPRKFYRNVQIGSYP